MRKLLLLTSLLLYTACTPVALCGSRATELQGWTQSELDLVDLINDYRAELGLNRFTLNQDLKIESNNRAEVLYFLPAVTHDGIGNAFSALGSKCYQGLTEVLGSGYTTIDSAFHAFKVSGEHNKIFIIEDRCYIGVTNSIRQDGQTIYVILLAKD